MLARDPFHLRYSRNAVTAFCGKAEDLVGAAQTTLSDDLDQEDPGAIHGAGDAEQGGGHEPVETTAPVRRQGDAATARPRRFGHAWPVISPLNSLPGARASLLSLAQGAGRGAPKVHP